MRVTWIGWNFFGNLSLVIYLVKVLHILPLFYCVHENYFQSSTFLSIKCSQGETNNEKLLGLLVFILEVFPQGLILVSALLHWHAPLPPRNCVAIELVGTAVNVPLRF